MPKTLQAVTTKGLRRELMARLEAIPEIWRTHCTVVDSTTQVEPYAWAGAVPSPREMIDGRRIKEIRAFTYDIRNKEYDLSVLFPRNWYEDDQIGAVKLRIADMADAWRNYKNTLFVYMLEQGGSLLAYDGATFFHDTRTEGDSGTIDNNTTSVAAADSAIPTEAEFSAQMSVIKALMAKYRDDQGNLANVSALTQIRVIAPVECEAPILTALNATQISGTTNVAAKGMAVPDFCPNLTIDATPTKTIFVHAVGHPHKGMIYQERTPLKVMIYDDPHWMDANNGLLVTLRERFVFAYGDFRRMVKHVFTT